MQWIRAFAGSVTALPGRLAALLALFAGPVVLLWVLYPVYFHTYVSLPLPSRQTVQALRSAPDEATLARLAAQRPLGPQFPRGREAVALAERWLSQFHAEGPSPSHPIAPVMTGAELMQDMGIGRLPFASLLAPDVLVQAYLASGEPRYLSTARDLILAFARHERSAWREPGLLWNDHAIAARVGVVMRFWASYRAHAIFSPEHAAEILQHAARSAALLAMPSHFAAWSNHGVMQNIALLQLTVAFPGLVDGQALGQLARKRLAMQWRYYISDEGVVLEHSAGYHREGTALLTLALELLELNQLAVPAAWRGQLARAEEFLAQLTRPDGTLPGYGDTRLELPAVPQRQVARAPEARHAALALYPLSGYAAWPVSAASSPGALRDSHSVATWSHFQGHAHKHADETGLVVWADGRGWITHSGYAPYGAPHRKPIEGWLGANAPHGEGEVPDPARRSTLLGSASAPGTVLLDVRRSTHDGAGYRRQIASLGGRLWLVIDQPTGTVPWSTTETIWTFYPDLQPRALGGNRFLLSDDKGHAMSVAVVAGVGVEARTSLHTGSRQPFAGWLATEQGMTPAPALRVLLPARGWSATLFDTRGAAVELDLRLVDGDNWQASGSGWQLQREGSRLVSRFGDRHEEVSVVAPPDTSKARAAIEAGLNATLSAYPKYRNLDHYRLRVAAGLAGLWLVQSLAYLGLRRLLRRCGWTAGTQAMIALFWGAVAVWLGASYFAT